VEEGGAATTTFLGTDSHHTADITIIRFITRQPAGQHTSEKMSKLLCSFSNGLLHVLGLLLDCSSSLAGLVLDGATKRLGLVLGISCTAHLPLQKRLVVLGVLLVG